jgi:type IV pilus assembly protein PilE
MPQRIASRIPDSAGFSLIELMVTVVIAAILISVAIPGYNIQVRKSRRTEAKTALLDLAAREERFYNMSNPPGYSTLPSDLGYNATTNSFPMNVGSGYYQVNIVLTAAAPPLPASYTITAVPITADQIKDTQCQNFTLTSSGQQTSTPNTTACWQ